MTEYRLVDDVSSNQIQLEGPGSAAPQEPEQPGSPQTNLQHDAFRPDLGQTDRGDDLMKDEDDTDGNV